MVIVGGGVAGVSTASALRAGGFDGQIVIVDAGEFPYDRPPLSKDYLLGTKDFKAITLQTGEWYDRNDIELRTATRVCALRPGEGRIELVDGDSLAADRVVLATGGAAARPPLPGIDSPRVHVLRTREDADALGAQIADGIDLLVIGAGLIGAEIASTAIDLGCNVTLVDPAPAPLEAVLGRDIAAWLHGLHAARGVQTLCAGVVGVRDTGAKIAVDLANDTGDRVVDAVVLGVGMVPECGLAEAAGLDVDRGIVVTDDQTTSNPAVLAVGDPTRRRKGDALLARAGHWEAAQIDGQRAAATILGVSGPAESAPWFWTDRHHRHVEAVGSLGDAAEIVLRGQPGVGPFAAFGLATDRIVGAVGVDDTHSVRAARRMIDRGLRVTAGELADPEVDLRKLLRRTR